MQRFDTFDAKEMLFQFFDTNSANVRDIEYAIKRVFFGNLIRPHYATASNDTLDSWPIRLLSRLAAGHKDFF